MVRTSAFLLLACITAVSAAAEWRPDRLLDDLYRPDRLAQLRPGVTCYMFSSYDRTGGNNDGFGGTYSKLRLEDGNSVLAEMEGAGAITRIWFTHSEYHEDGLLGLKGEHIRVYLDGNTTPAIDVPLEAIFSGTLEQFPEPLSGTGLGGFYCYVPIAYRNGCKVVVDGDNVRFYHINYLTFPQADDVTTFSMTMSAETQASLDKAVDAWSHLGWMSKLGVDHPDETLVEWDAASGETQTVSLPSGPRIIRAVLLENADLTKDDGRIAMTWDGESSAAVDMPLRFFFGQPFACGPYQSLFIGNTPNGYYNYYAMPYGREATMAIDAPPGSRVRVLTEPLPDGMAGMGYFHGLYHEELPTTPKVLYPWLKRSGTGHYVGTFLATAGDDWLPFWLEGDESFVVDGELRMHGTGSEDYFNCGWYAVKNRLNQPGAMPLHGFPMYRESIHRSIAAAYRWHILDAMPYSESIDAGIEHGAENHLAADYRSGVFFYDASPQSGD